MIHCIAPNNINLEQLSIAFDFCIKKYLPNTCIVLETNESYWKEPSSNNIIYSVLNNKAIKIADFICLFPLSWQIFRR